MPYLYRNAVETHITGIPTMRSMILEYMDDPVCRFLDRQYMFGDDLLVAPIFNPEGEAEYYLPAGKWTNFLTNEVVEGGSYRSEHHGYLSIPCYVKENSIVAVGAVDTTPEYDFAKDVTLKVYQLKDLETATTSVYNMKAEEELLITVDKSENNITIKVTATVGKPYKVYLHSIKGIQSAAGMLVTEDEFGTMLVPEDFSAATSTFEICL